MTLPAVFEQLEPRFLLSSQLLITELLAVNDHVLADEDGDYSDWIEVHNPTTSAVPLAGLHLTDDPDEPDKWTFPDVSLGPGEFLIVFASGKDRRDPAGLLHTNFALSGDGEYLALVDGSNQVIHEYAGGFGPQYADISYGLAQDIHETVLVAAGATARYRVPTASDAAMGLGWTATGFNHAAWSSGPTGIGFANLSPGLAVWNYKANTSVGSLAQAYSVIGDSGLQSAVYTETAAVINYNDGSSGPHFTQDSRFPGVSGADDFVVDVYAIVTIPAAGAWSFGVNSDDGFSLDLSRGATQFSMSYPNPRGPGDTISTFNFPAAGDYELHLVYFERGGGAEVELFAAQGAYTSYNTNFRLVGDVTNGGLEVNCQPADGAGGGGALRELVATDVKGAMLDHNASLYVRIPFTVANPAALTSLALKMKYDDGYVAYLNGTEIARRNAPASTQWNSSATASRNDIQATTYENVDVTVWLGLLQTGANVLAIQALNYSAADGDLLVLPALVQIEYMGLGEHYFATPSPGEPNGEDYWLHVEDTKFSVDRGFYSQPFDVAIAVATEGAEIYYTTDGSDPSPANGTLYAGPIPINHTTVLRAAAFKSGHEPSNVDTQTYLFVADIIRQSPNGEAPGPGWPTGSVNGQSIDYGMDPDVVNNPAYSSLIDDALLAIPTLSLVTNVANLFNPSTGIYVNAGQDGSAWERPVSVELIDPGGGGQFQIDAGLRIRGGFSRSGGNPKHAFRLLFRDEYGAGKLVFPMFGDEGVDEFDNLDLRTAQNYSWSFQGDGNNLMVRDVFSRDLQGAMGQPYTRSRYYHLYINGQYWGLYQTEERAEASFAASYMGGSPDDYDVVKVEAGPYTVWATDGNLDAWTRLYNAAMAGFASDVDYYRIQGFNTDGTRNAAYERLVDVDNLIDCMINVFFAGDRDGPVSGFLSNNRPNNFYGIYNRVNPDGWKFIRHDAEHTLDRGEGSRIGPYPAGDQLQYFNPQFLHERLMLNAEYRMRFADRAHRYLYNGGLLTPAATQAAVMARANQIDLAIIAESARWGDAKRTTPFTRNGNWLPRLNDLVNNYLAGRTNTLIGQLRGATTYGAVYGVSSNISAPLYPSVEAPTFRVNGVYKHGGKINLGDDLTMTAPAGTMYYTLNGSDPRLPGGALSPLAIPYAGPIDMTRSYRVKSRVYSGGQWSALNEAFYVPDVTGSLRIGELMYSPAAAPIGSDYLTQDFEYVELTNTGSVPLYLDGVQIAGGIDFTFPDVTVTPGQTVLVVANRAAFESRYGTGLPVAGEYTGLLDNAGDRICLYSALGELIQDFTYSDGWFAHTDGGGFSLTIRNPGGALALWNDKAGWQASSLPGGTPGAGDIDLIPGSVILSEVLAHSDLAPNDWIELYNTTDQPVDIGGWYLSDSDLNLTAWRIPPGTVIAGHSYRFFTEDDDFGPAVNPGGGFALSEHGDEVFLSSGAGGEAGGYREHVDFGASPNGLTFGLYVKPAGGTDFTLLVNPTMGTPNAAPFVGPLVINEIMYHPADPPVGSGYNDEALEFIELHNRSSQTLDLTRYYLAGGAGFTFGWYSTDTSATAVWTLQADATATWQAALPEAGDWQVLVFFSADDGLGGLRALDSAAQYRVDRSGGSTTVRIDQSLPENSGQWVSLGTFSFGAGPAGVTLSRGADNPDRQLIADRIKFVKGAAEIVVDNLDAGFSTTGSAITSLAPGEYVVLVRDLAAFDDRYHITASGIPVAGQYTGLLANEGDVVKLFEASNPEVTGYIPYVRIDQVAYDNEAPWSEEPDGSGVPLNRLVPGDYGNDAGNWASGSAGGSPGSLNVHYDTSAPSTPAGLTAVGAGPTQIDLAWQPSVDTDSRVDHYVIYRDGTAIDTAPGAAYSDTSALQGQVYVYRVSAVNPDGYESPRSASTSGTAQLAMGPALAPDSTHVRVFFGMPVDLASAQTIANYAVVGPAGAVTIVAASRDADPSAVTLSLAAPLTEAVPYTLTVNNVADQYGSGVAGDSQTTFEYRDVDPALLAWWQFDEGSGLLAADSTGLGHGLAIVGAAWAPGGRIGSALYFDGNDDYAVDDDGEAYLNGLGAVTVAMWIRADETGTDRGFLTTRDPGSSLCLNIGYDLAGFSGFGNNLIKTYLQTTSANRQVEGASGTQTTAWQHVAVTWTSGGSVLLYVDGLLQTATYDPGPIGGVLSGATTVIVGHGNAAGSGGAWKGLIDDVRIYGRALNQAEIAGLANVTPTADDDEYDAVAGAVLAVPSGTGVLANDDDGDGGPQPLTASLVQDPSHGQVVLNADGSFQYTSNVGFRGEDTFTYQAYDGQAHSASATVTLTVAPPAGAPTADDLDLETDEEAATAGQVAATDPESQPLTFRLIDSPAHGLLDFHDDGSFLYTPEEDFDETDTFTFVASDGQYDTNLATVTITVRPINDRPTVENLDRETDEDVTVDDQVAGSDAEGETLLFSLVDGPAQGMLDFRDDGSFTYVPPADWSGTASFTFVATDGLEDSDLGTVHLIFHAVNDPPEVEDLGVSTPEEAPVGGQVTGSDAEDETLVFSLVGGPAHGLLDFQPDGTFLYTPEKDFDEIDSFTFVANDGTSDSSPGTVTIDVQPVNDAPTVADQDLATDEEIPTGGQVAYHDADGDLPLVALVDGTAHGRLYFMGDGTFTYQPDNDWFGVDQFTYLASDGQASSEPGTVRITVRPVNDAPRALDQSPSTPEDTDLAGQVAGQDVEDDPLTYRLIAGPAHGQLDFQPDGSFLYTPADDFDETDTFTFVANDGQADSNIATVTVSVTPVNDDPVAVIAADVTVGEVPLTVHFDAAGSFDADGDELTCSWDFGDGATAQGLQVTHTFVVLGAHTVTLTADDGAGGTGPATQEITVQVAKLPDLAFEAVEHDGGLYFGAKTFSVATAQVNAGDKAVAAMTGYRVEARLSLDRQWGNADDVIVYSAIDNAARPDAAVWDQTLEMTIPKTAAGGSYYLAIMLDSGDVIFEHDGANNTWWSDEADVEIIEVDRLDLRNGRAWAATYEDHDGDKVKVTISGGGTGMVIVPKGGQADALEIDIRQITPRSTLTITVTKAGEGDGTTTVGDVLVGGSIRSIIGKTTTLTGNLTVDALLKVLTLDDVVGGHIEINRDEVLVGRSDSVKMTFDKVADTRVDTHTLPISSLTATEWLDTDDQADEIAAPWIATLTTKGRKRGTDLSDGDFQAGLTLTGANGRGLALGGARVAGQVAGAWVLQVGKTGTIRGLTSAGDWLLSVPAGNVAGLTFAGDLNGTLQAEYFGTIAARGDLSADISATGADPRSGKAIGKLSAASVRDTSVTAPAGGIGSVTALEWLDEKGPADQVTAAWLGTLRIQGRRQTRSLAAIDGNFEAGLELTGAGLSAKKSTLGVATIAGGVGASHWTVTGDARTVSILGVVDGWELDVLDRPVGEGVRSGSLATLKLGDVTWADVAVADLIGTAKSLRWAGGSLQADRITTLAVTGRRASRTAAQIDGDFRADLSLLGQNVPARQQTLRSATIAHDVSESFWQVVGDIRSLSVAHAVLDSAIGATGSILSLKLAEGQRSDFFAGIDLAVVEAELRCPQSDDDFTDGEAALKSVLVGGWRLAKGEEAQRFLVDCNFSAPSFGSLDLRNPQGYTLHVRGEAGNIAWVRHRDSANDWNNWKWYPSKGGEYPGVGECVLDIV